MHRELLVDSMKTAVDVNGREGLLAHIRKEFSDFWPVPDFADEKLHIKPYSGDDDRIGWKDVHIVTIDDYGVVGFCENPSSL